MPAVAIAIALLAAPASAAAADTYADAGRPDDSGDCLTPVTACRTIAAALSRSGPGDTTFVADGTYVDPLSLDGGRSLVSLDSEDPRPLIDSGVDPNAAIHVQSGGAGTVSGFQLRSGSVGMRIEGAVTVEDNVFDEASVPAFAGAQLVVSAGAPIAISNNLFTDPDATGQQFGIQVDSSETPVISGNTFTDLAAGVILYGSPLISGNEFSDLRPVGLTGFGVLPGAGVLALGGMPTISENTFGPAAQDPVAGVYLQTVAPLVIPGGASLSRNEFTGNEFGLRAVDTNLPVTLSDDLIYENAIGIDSVDSSGENPDTNMNGDVAATNVTVFNSAQVGVRLNHTTLTLDSSILGSPIELVGAGACVISFSRGPATAGSNGCGDFVTNAAPDFVGAATGNFRLESTSDLIDSGNPAAPLAGALDFYGGPRAVQGRICSTVRRDIGADEYDPSATPECPLMPLPPIAGPPPLEVPRAPDIERRPARQSTDRSPTFGFAGDLPGSTFRCKLDGRTFRPCVSPVTYRGLSPGKHQFRVYALAPDGQRGEAQVIRFRVLRRD